MTDKEEAVMRIALNLKQMVNDRKSPDEIRPVVESCVAHHKTNPLNIHLDDIFGCKTQSPKRHLS